jgi:hypothetical protein
MSATHASTPTSKAICKRLQRGTPHEPMSDKTRIVTLINVFAVDLVNQQRLVDLLIRATDGFVSSAPGLYLFDAPLQHRWHKGAMYAQRRSAEDYQAIRQDPGALPFFH